MVGSNKEVKKMESDIRESEMIDEGGLGVEADYNYDKLKEDKKSELELKSSKMMGEGGLGAKLYYEKEEMLVDADAVAKGKKTK